MNTRVETLNAAYSPEVAIMVYRSKSPITGNGEYYLESHNINEQGAIMEGKPLKQDTIQGIVDLFFDERKNSANIKGLLPDNLLSFQLLPGGNYSMVWYRPAEIRVMHHAVQLKLPTNKTWVPALIYDVERTGMDIYALNSNSRPKLTTKLFKAPFFNVNDEGDVCLGNAQVKKPKEKTYSALMQYWEDLFWLSEFSHVNGEEKVKSKSLNKVWKRLLSSKTKLKWSDIDELLPYDNKTLKNIL